MLRDTGYDGDVFLGISGIEQGHGSSGPGGLSEQKEQDEASSKSNGQANNSILEQYSKFLLSDVVPGKS